jgi:hypothetical protein
MAGPFPDPAQEPLCGTNGGNALGRWASGQRHLTFSASKFSLKHSMPEEKIHHEVKKVEEAETYLTYSTLWLKNCPKLDSFPEHES